MIIDIPKTNPIKQLNKGNLLGSIAQSFNMDFESNSNKIRVSPRGLKQSDGADLANLDFPPVAFGFFNSRYYCVTDDGVFRTTSNNDLTSAWEEVTDVNNDTYGIGSDMITYNSKLYLRGTDKLVSWNGSSDSTVGSGYSSRSSMTVFDDRLYFTTDDDQILSMSAGESVASATSSYTLNINTAIGLPVQITKIQAVSNGIWIGVLYTDREGGEMIFWDGVFADTPTARYKLDDGVLSFVIKDDRPYCVDSFGKLWAFDNSSFTLVAQLPVDGERMKDYKSATEARWIHKNGMCVSDENEILMLVSNEKADTTTLPVEALAGGVWAYNEDYGLYHKYSPSMYDITTASQKDLGQFDIYRVGAIVKAEFETTTTETKRSHIIAGIEYYTDNDTTIPAIMLTDFDDDLQKAGVLVTTQIQAEEIEEAWQKIFAVHKKFDSDTNKIVMKYRTEETDPIYIDITWTSTTTFTTTDTDMIDIKRDLQNGHDFEVAVLRGDGAGMCSHVTNISKSGSTYTVTLDETHTGVTTNQAKVRFQKWKKIGTTSDTTELYKECSVGATSTWIQFKIWCLFTGKQEIERIISVSEKHKPFKS